MKKLLPLLSVSCLIVILTVSTSAQQRLLVSPFGDAIPIGKNQGAAELLRQSMTKRATSAPLACSDKATFGYSLDDYPNPGTNHIGFHQDIMAMWYVAPASGTIDTIFWRQTDLGSADSTVTLRLFESNIYPGTIPQVSRSETRPVSEVTRAINRPTAFWA